MKLGVIVEGHGDVFSAPVLIRRIAERLGLPALEIPRPHRVPRGKLLKESEVRRAIELMARKTAPDGALLVLLDGDDDCPAELGPRLLAWATAERSDRRIAVVVAKRELEAWFLAAARSLRGRRGLPDDLEPPPAPEDVRDAKGWLHARMPNGYSETLDQPALASVVSLEEAEACSSFAKLVRDLHRLIAPAG